MVKKIKREKFNFRGILNLDAETGFDFFLDRIRPDPDPQPRPKVHEDKTES